MMGVASVFYFRETRKTKLKRTITNLEGGKNHGLYDDEDDDPDRYVVDRNTLYMTKLKRGDSFSIAPESEDEEHHEDFIHGEEEFEHGEIDVSQILPITEEDNEEGRPEDLEIIQAYNRQKDSLIIPILPATYDVGLSPQSETAPRLSIQPPNSKRSSDVGDMVILVDNQGDL